MVRSKLQMPRRSVRQRKKNTPATIGEAKRTFTTWELERGKGTTVETKTLNEGPTFNKKQRNEKSCIREGKR